MHSDVCKFHLRHWVALSLTRHVSSIDCCFHEKTRLVAVSVANNNKLCGGRQIVPAWGLQERTKPNRYLPLLCASTRAVARTV